MAKKSLMVIFSIITMISLSGCWAQDIDMLEADLNARAQVNQGIVDKLIDANLLEESTGETLKKSIEKTIKEASNITKSGITWYLAHGIGCWYPEPTANWYVGGSFPYRGGSIGTSYGDGRLITDQNLIEPIPMVGVEQVEMLKKELAYKVWVLKPPQDDELHKYKALDEISALVDLIKKETDKKQRSYYFSRLEQYFYNTNEPVLNPEKDLIIAETVMPGLSSYHVCECDDPECKGVTITAPQSRTLELGYDLMLKHSTVPVVGIRILEFNPKVVQKLIDVDGVNKDKYLNDPEGKRVFLLEYPVHYVDKIEIDGESKYKCTVKESDIIVNIYNGILKDKQGNELRQRKNTLIHIGGGGGTNEPGTSSFVLYDKSKVYGIGYANKQVDTSAVVLRDYLELMYMTNVVSGEDIVAPGRRIRIINFTGDIGRQAASFIDASGRIVERVQEAEQEDLQDDVRDTFGYDNPAHEIYVTDFVDLPTIGENGAKNKLKPVNVASLDNTNENSNYTEETGEGNNPETSEGDSDNAGEERTGYITDDYSGGRLLKINYVSSISPTCRFPSEYIAKSDVNNETESTPAVGESDKTKKIIFYGILTDKNPFQTAMYSGWINTDNENGSLSWWNDWLKQNDFLYFIDPNNMDNAFMGNFQFDMAKEGFVVLNLDTISKIQKEMDHKRKSKEVNTIRTIFIVLGFCLMAYSMVLIAAWAFDCVILTGFNLLTLLTFGKWVAVRSSYDIPDADIEGRYYVDFQKVLISGAIIMGVGFLLTIVDVIEIVATIIRALGGISEMIDKVIFKN